MDQAAAIALSLPDVLEQPHFEKTSFRIRKKIFLTLDAQQLRGCFKLSVIDQDVFSVMNPGIIFPVPNSWGKQGWTWVDLERISIKVFEDLAATAYQHVLNSGKAKPK